MDDLSAKVIKIFCPILSVWGKLSFSLLRFLFSRLNTLFSLLKSLFISFNLLNDVSIFSFIYGIILIFASDRVVRYISLDRSNTGDMESKQIIRLGIDLGSTTAKVVAVNELNEIVYSKYMRHHARVKEALLVCLEELKTALGNRMVSVRITGSIGMGVAEKYAIPFVQEVVAATRAIRQTYPGVQSLIDIGGEDAKVVFFKDGETKDLRMNGNCAGGTGAFIDQMAVILGVEVEELDRLATRSTKIYPIASRCGVFCKTDIQNLVAKNVSREDIAASIFHAVAVQTVVTLAHGCDIKAPVLFCGGPLTFMPTLRKAFKDYLSLKDEDIILPGNGTQLPALGTALYELIADREKELWLSELLVLLQSEPGRTDKGKLTGLPPVFKDEMEYRIWQMRMAERAISKAPLRKGVQQLFIGIDSGSTTTKIVVTDQQARLLYSYYANNNGNPIDAVEQGLRKLKEDCETCGAELHILGGCSTGYGEDLVKAAFGFRWGIVETIAHYLAARHLNPEVSFIFDIGGQDMKAVFVSDGVINRIEINEACSSGCGSFIETFAKNLGYTPAEFAGLACRAKHPCDLGTRCTVFMNSKVKQVLREGATVEDIAAGLAYSVVKNCLYKVLKLKDVSALGKHVFVQGGTMRNDAVVRAIELLTGAEVTRCDLPELMGAYGCALYAARHVETGGAVTLDELTGKASFTTRELHCKGCQNQCRVTAYTFANGRRYYSGNRCERVFTNGENGSQGLNAYKQKEKLLFDRPTSMPEGALTIGIPRCLNMFEDYPFWHALFTGCGLRVCLSDASDYKAYERDARMVMSDNICFPAKLVHSHIRNLQEKKVDRIFMPFVVFEKQRDGYNSYNCPIVTGYSEVVKGVQEDAIPIDSPAITFKDKSLLREQCKEYLTGLGIPLSVISQSYEEALQAQSAFEAEAKCLNERVLAKARETGALAILLAGRPYHTDSLIQHGVGDMLAGMGIYVLTDDIVRGQKMAGDDAHFVEQWAYPTRILDAARWCAAQDRQVQFVEMTSFGCGPDAFLVDEVRSLLMRHGKSLTLLKLDDINNVGSMKLRARSLLESLKLLPECKEEHLQQEETFVTTPVFDKAARGRKILIPFFTPFLSPLLPAIMKVAGYEVENLPLSDTRSAEWGLKYANNEVCYPATLIVGDIIKAFKSGHYEPSKTAVAITQTGGQCRASNYLPLIKKALVDAGYGEVPVISVTFGDMMGNYQPGFKMNWLKLMPVAVRSILFTDCMAKFYYASVVREKEKGQARRLTTHYLEEARKLILERHTSELFDLLAEAAGAFKEISREADYPKVGVVGEIFLKFNPFAQQHVTDWLTGQGIEVVPPLMTGFFLQSFVNQEAWSKSHIERSHIPSFFSRGAYRLIWKEVEHVNRICARYPYFTPFEDIYEQAHRASQVITLNAQFGEGWLLPGEIVSYAMQGVQHVVSLQPFGCIANHIVAKGMEKRITRLFPDMNLLSLDFDSGVSEVNVTNRLLLFTNNLKK